jgi:hypothetical protein
MKVMLWGWNDSRLESMWTVVEDIVQVYLVTIHPLSSSKDPSIYN